MEYYTISELKDYARQNNIRLPGLTRKADILNAIQRPNLPTHDPIQTNPVEHSIDGINQRFELLIHDYKGVWSPQWMSMLSLIQPLTNKCFPGSIGYSSNTKIYTLVSDNKAIALAAFDSNPINDVSTWGPNSYYLYNVCTDPLFRGKHLQELLLKNAFTDLKHGFPINVYLYVDVTNASAIKLYTRLGFSTVKQTIFNGIPAILMHLRVN